MQDTGDERLEDAAPFPATARRERPHRAPVIATVPRDELVLAGMPRLLVVLACQLQRRLGRLGATGEELDGDSALTTHRRRCDLAQPHRQLDGRGEWCRAREAQSAKHGAGRSRPE